MYLSDDDTLESMDLSDRVRMRITPRAIGTLWDEVTPELGWLDEWAQNMPVWKSVGT